MILQLHYFKAVTSLLAPLNQMILRHDLQPHWGYGTTAQSGGVSRIEYIA